MIRLSVIIALLACPCSADTVFAAQTVRSQDVITRDHLVVKDGDLPGTFGQLEDVVGKEARVVIYAGQPVARNAVQNPALIERNQLVTLVFQSAGMTIKTDGRALDRGGVGASVRVMNLTSRNSLTGTVLPDGTVEIGR